MSEIEERVARAICSAAGKDPDAPFIGPHGKACDFPEWERWRGEARAAIAAMRKPARRRFTEPKSATSTGKKP